MGVCTYKTIYRVDYQAALRLIDNLGHFGSLTKIKGEASSKTETKVNLLEHSIQTTSQSEQDPWRLQLNLQDLDVLIEHKAGLEVSTLQRHPSVVLGELLIRELGKEEITRFERAGLRLWILVQHDKFEFGRVRDHLLSRQGSTGRAIQSQFGSVQDLGVVFEAKSDEQDECRILFGPYQASERRKYFSLDPGISQGLILDVDMWQSRVEVPSFNLPNFVRHAAAKITAIVEGVVEETLKEL